MTKKKAPVTKALEEIHCIMDQQDTKSMERSDYVKLLQDVNWNLHKAWGGSNMHMAQALGMVRGALRGLGVEPDNVK